MPLLMLDLDNTLIDRDAAFRLAVGHLLAEHDLPPADAEWVMTIDQHGYRPRSEVAAAFTARWGDRLPADAAKDFFERGAADFVTLDAATEAALRGAIGAGWTAVVVTNGGAAQQRAKLRNSRLDQIVSGWIISDELGYHKPEPEIFAAAADAVGSSIDGAWMIGDAAHADIAGAHAVGMSSVWLSLGRTWPGTLPYAPDHIALTLPAAIEHVLSRRA